MLVIHAFHVSTRSSFKLLLYCMITSRGYTCPHDINWTSAVSPCFKHVSVPKSLYKTIHNSYKNGLKYSNLLPWKIFPRLTRISRNKPSKSKQRGWTYKNSNKRLRNSFIASATCANNRLTRVTATACVACAETIIHHKLWLFYYVTSIRTPHALLFP